MSGVLDMTPKVVADRLKSPPWKGSPAGGMAFYSEVTSIGV